MRAAIELSQVKSKHSEFYYKLRGLNERIKIYKSSFYDKIPSFQRNYMRQLELKHRRQREIFEKEANNMKLN